MAAFRIHEDLEKENWMGNSKITENTGNLMNAKNGDKRNTNVFGILDNKQITNITQALNLKNIGGKKNDENDYTKHVISKGKTGNAVPVDQFKAFFVYEDTESNNETLNDKENEPSTSSASQESISTSAIREPLSEIKDGISTPMSVGDCLTPMSVDKSMLEDIGSLKCTQPKNEKYLMFEVKEYQSNIYDYLREVETRNRPKHGYMKKQPDITHTMRTILVDWLVEVSEEYKLHSETLCLAVSYIDRFLSCMSVVRAKLQLVGTAAMFIAAKYEEIYPPDVAEFVYITDDTYTKKQVLRMEQLILKVLSFDLSVPTTMVFVNLFSVMLNFPDKIKNLSLFFCELSLLEADPYLQYVPSQIAAASLALARYMLNFSMWDKNYEESLGFKLDDIKHIILNLNQTHKMATKLVQQAIQEKYKSSKYMEVSNLNPCELDETFIDELIEKISLNNVQTETPATLENQENNEDVRKMISRICV